MISKTSKTFYVLMLAMLIGFNGFAQCNLSLISSATSPNCEDPNPGNVLVFPTNNAAPPFIFSLYDNNNVLVSNNTNGVFSNLTPGTYNATVLDAFNCTANTNVIVPFFNVPEISINNLESSYCLYQGNITLIGQPFGTILTINGTQTNTFNTILLGLGTHIVAYEYIDVASTCVLTGAFTFNIVQNNPAFPLFPIAYCATDNSDYPLATTAGGGTFVLNGNPITSINPFQLGVGQHILDYYYFDGNCSNNVQYNILVNQPNMVLNHFAVGLNVTVSGPPDATAFNWTLPNNATANTQNTSFIAPNFGSYTICLEAFFGNCSVLQCEQINLTVNNVSSGFIFQQTGTSFDFLNQSVNATNYLWNFGDGSTSVSANPTHQFANNGNFQVCLDAINGADIVQYCDYVNINCTFPEAGFYFAANGLLVNFGNNSDDATTYSWDFGDGTGVSFEEPNHSFATQGVYNVCLTSTNECGSDETCQNVSLVCPTPQVAIDFTANNLEYNFDANVINGNNYLWIFGDGTTSNQPNISHTYATADIYTVCLSSSNNCGTYNECIVLDVVCDQPIADFIVQSDGADAIFTFNNSNFDNIIWNFGDGNTSTLNNPTHTFSTLGTYTVCVNVSNLCGSDQICQNVNISCAPFVDFELVQLTDLTFATANNSINATTYQWLVDNVTQSNNANPVITLPSSGMFEICLVANNTCGNNQYCQMIEVECLPIDVNFQLSQNADDYYGNFDVINANVDYIYEWYINGYYVATQPNFSYNFFVDGDYQVCLNTINYCDTLELCEDFEIVCPQAIATFDQIQNSSLIYTFNADDTDATDYIWTIDNANVSTASSFTYDFQADGTYSICLLLSNGCDIASFCSSVTVACLPPNISFNIDQTNTEATYNFSTAIFLNQFSWMIDGTLVSNDQNFTHVFDLEISETDTVEICLNGFNECNLFGNYCEDVIVSSIFSFNVLNVIDVSCFGVNDGFVELEVMEGSNAAIITFDNLSATTTFVTTTLGNGQTIDIPVEINEPAVVFGVVNTTNTICESSSAQGAIEIFAGGGVEPYIYYINGNSSFESTFDDLAYGDYEVYVEDANGCIYEADSVFIDAINNIEIVVENVNGSNYSNQGAIDISVNGTASPFTYVWSNGLESEDLNNLESGNYEVTVTDADGCKLSLTITVSDIVGLEQTVTFDYKIYPNPINDFLNIETETIIKSASIYNQKAQLIKQQFAINNNSLQLDLANLPTGIYQLKLITEDGILIKKLIKQ